ncbi:hypothetical protein Ciccas_008276, partial [Cichlidogyrus casuarinus]
NVRSLGVRLDSSLRADWTLEQILGADQKIWNRFGLSNVGDGRLGESIPRRYDELCAIRMQSSRVCGVIGIEPTSLSLLLRLKSCGYQTMTLSAQIPAGLDKSMQGTIRSNDLHTLLNVCDHVIIFDFTFMSSNGIRQTLHIDEEFLRFCKPDSNLIIMAQDTSRHINFDTLRDALNSNLLTSITILDSDLWNSLQQHNNQPPSIWKTLFEIKSETRLHVLPSLVGLSRNNLEQVERELRKILIDISREKSQMAPRMKVEEEKCRVHNSMPWPPFSVEAMCKNRMGEAQNISPDSIARRLESAESESEQGGKNSNFSTLELWCEILKRARDQHKAEEPWRPPSQDQGRNKSAEDMEQDNYPDRADSNASSTPAASGTSSLTSACPIINRSLPINGN